MLFLEKKHKGHNKIGLLDDMSCGIGSNYTISMHMPNHERIRYYLILDHFHADLNKEEYMKMLFYGYYHDF